MQRSFFIVATVCLFAAVSSQNMAYQPIKYEPRPVVNRNFPPYNMIPVEPRTELVAMKENLPDDAYEYSVIPRAEYPLAEENPVAELIDPSIEAVVDNCISNSFNIIKSIVSGAVSVVVSLIPKLGLAALGAALFIGFCTFTPFCKLTLKEPFLSELAPLNPYLDYAESAVNVAINKYKDIF